MTNLIWCQITILKCGRNTCLHIHESIFLNFPTSSRPVSAHRFGGNEQGGIFRLVIGPQGLILSLCPIRTVSVPSLKYNAYHVQTLKQPITIAPSSSLPPPPPQSPPHHLYHTCRNNVVSVHPKTWQHFNVANNEVATTVENMVCQSI